MIGPHRPAAVLGVLAALVGGLMVLASPLAMGEAGAQSNPIQVQIIEGVLEQGWWDEDSMMSAEEMAPIVEEWGDEFAFAITSRPLEVQDNPDRNAAALLAQNTLQPLVQAGGPQTLLLVTGGDVGGASTFRPFVNLQSALDGFDRSEPEQSFAAAAAAAAALGDQIPVAGPAQTSFFGDYRIFVLLAIVTGILALASIRSAQKKKRRTVHTADARGDTNLQLQAMSDLILDLDPRVTIANDKALKERYVDASTTYREVLETAAEADTGHEVADLRIAIAKARWKLDVIDAELDGREPPAEPHTRNTDGSAWDSTRGTGAE